MRILYVNNEEEDYLADSVLFGMLTNTTVEVYQFPLKKILYKKYKGLFSIRGNGFTLYHLLDDNHIHALNSDFDPSTTDLKFDLIIFSSIQRQYQVYQKWFQHIRKANVWILDGEDTPAMYPYHGYFWRRPSLWFLPKAHDRFLYFKREWTPVTMKYLYFKILPSSLLAMVHPPKNLRPISFSIPEQKIIDQLPVKKKMFPMHIVDEEVAGYVKGSHTKYAFDSEAAYYHDLQISRYGITTKRAGWDCLRHYEIAANGAVICFKNLEQKPDSCAPHGLKPGFNCIGYKDYKDLMIQISNIDNQKYLTMQLASLEWVKHNSCENMAERLMANYLQSNII